MVGDTSAPIAMLLREPDCLPFREALATTADPCLSGATWCEAAMVLTGRFGIQGRMGLDTPPASVGATIPPVDARLGRAAYDAWLRYGKGRHLAGLNFGDCFSYALAKIMGDTLLFKGEDFSQTDIRSALAV